MTEPWRKAYELPPDLPMWQWAERHVILGIRQPTAYKGPYRTDLTPYVRGVFDALKDDSIHTVTVKKAAQTGLSLVVHCAMCYWVCEDPDPVLLVLPSADIGRSMSETRLQPLIEDSERVAKELADDPDDFKKMQYQLRHCTVNIVGSNSAANLASRPVRWLILDEVDKYPEQTGKEARAVNLAIERTKTYEFMRKIVEISTPTNKAGHITVSYGRADQRRYFVPCPKCKTMQVLEFERIRFDSKLPVDEAAAGAYYECESGKCEYRWTDGDKNNAVEAGEWRATARSHDPGHVSFHLPSFYAPWVKWSDVVTNFMDSKDIAADLQNFVNSTLGNEWQEPPVESIEGGLVIARQEACVYERGVVPTDKPCLVAAMVDVQKQHLVYSVWAMDYSNQWMIDHGLLSTPDDVASLFDRIYYHGTGAELRVAYVLNDAAYRTSEIYEIALADRRIIPIVGLHGVDFKPSEYIVPREVKSFPGGKMFGGKRKLTLVHLHPSEFKNQTSRALSEKGPVSIWFHKDIDDLFVEQMCGEVKRETKPDRFGQVHTFWEKIGKNDYFDCTQYSFAYRHMMTNKLLGLRGDDEEEPAPAKAAPEKKPPEPQEDAVMCRNCGHSHMAKEPHQNGHKCPKCRWFQSTEARNAHDRWEDHDG